MSERGEYYYFNKSTGEYTKFCFDTLAEIVKMNNGESVESAINSLKMATVNIERLFICENLAERKKIDIAKLGDRFLIKNISLNSDANIGWGFYLYDGTKDILLCRENDGGESHIHSNMEILEKISFVDGLLNYDRKPLVTQEKLDLKVLELSGEIEKNKSSFSDVQEERLKDISNGKMEGKMVIKADSPLYLAGTVSGGQLEVSNSGAGMAGITLKNQSNYTVNFGIDQDNFLKIGGVSLENTAHKIWHEGMTTLVNSANDGFQKFPNGLLIQWGTTPKFPFSLTSVVRNITFPIAFKELYHLSYSSVEGVMSTNSSLLKSNGFFSFSSKDSVKIGWIAIGLSN